MAERGAEQSEEQPYRRAVAQRDVVARVAAEEVRILFIYELRAYQQLARVDRIERHDSERGNGRVEADQLVVVEQPRAVHLQGANVARGRKIGEGLEVHEPIVADVLRARRALIDHLDDAAVALQ